MASTDRAHYAVTRPYDDAPQSIPRPSHVAAHATISAPHVHAMALETLVPRLKRDETCSVLDVGCGSGYLMACLSRLVSPGKVVGIDHLTYLVDTTRRNLMQDFGHVPDEVVLVQGDGRAGVPEYAPYDAIHVGAAASVVPDALIAQLKSPGIMFIPVGEVGGNQYIYIVEKDKDGNVTRKQSHGVRYVPLTDAERQGDD